MTSIIGKTIKGHTYYYSERLPEWRQTEGRLSAIPGKAADIEAAISGATVMPDRTRHLAFGDVAAVWEMLRRLKVTDIVDDVVGSRRSDAGASVGTYIALAVLNRVVDPCSKLAFETWWAKTAGERWLGLRQEPSTIGAFGMRWMRSPRAGSKRSNGASSRPWSQRSRSTAQGSCWT